MAGIVNLFRGKYAERDIFTSLLRPHVDVMYRMALRWTGQPADAEDLVQDVLTRLAGRVAEIQAVEQLRPWLLKVLYRQYVDLYRRRRRSPEINESSLSAMAVEAGEEALQASSPLSTAAAPDCAETLALRQQLHQALQALDEDQRTVILLHDAEGYSAAEVSEILEISIGTVKSRLHRGRQLLKNLLGSGTF